MVAFFSACYNNESNECWHSSSPRVVAKLHIMTKKSSKGYKLSRPKTTVHQLVSQLDDLFFHRYCTTDCLLKSLICILFFQLKKLNHIFHSYDWVKNFHKSFQEYPQKITPAQFVKYSIRAVIAKICCTSIAEKL